MQKVSISLKNKNYNELIAMEKDTGLNKSAIINQAMEKYIEILKEEDIEDAKTAVLEWNKFVKRGMKSIPAEEVYKELGI